MIMCCFCNWRSLTGVLQDSSTWPLLLVTNIYNLDMIIGVKLSKFTNDMNIGHVVNSEMEYCEYKLFISL